MTVASSHPVGHSRRERLQVVGVALAGVACVLAVAIFFAGRVTAPGDGTQIIYDFARLFPEGLPVEVIAPAPDGLETGDLVVSIQGRSVNDLIAQAFTGRWNNETRIAAPGWEYVVLREGRL